jgi:hypothetical protein
VFTCVHPERDNSNPRPLILFKVNFYIIIPSRSKPSKFSTSFMFPTSKPRINLSFPLCFGGNDSPCSSSSKIWISSFDWTNSTSHGAIQCAIFLMFLLLPFILNGKNIVSWTILGYMQVILKTKASFPKIQLLFQKANRSGGDTWSACCAIYIYIYFFFEREVLFNTLLISNDLCKFIYLLVYWTVHHHPFLPHLPDVLSTVSENSYGIRVKFIESDTVFTIFLFRGRVAQSV